MSVYDQYTPPATGDGAYFKLRDAESAVVRIAGEPYIFQSEYKGNIATKYAWPIYNVTAQQAQVWQASMTTFKRVQGLAKDEEWGNPETYNIKVTREGEMKETVYHLNPSPNKTPLTDTQKAEVAKLDMEKMIKGSIPLSQVVGGKEIPKPQSNVNPMTGEQPPIENYDQSPINLDDIPF
jgi:hypothetical protein